jgi:two-component system, OmpR family, sensor histidine kinase KdpD
MADDIEELRRLIALMAHRVRSPLSVITGRSSVLQATATPDQAHELASIHREANRVSRAIENVLVIANIDTGDASDREWVPVEELVGAALATLGAEFGGLTVEIGIPEGLLVHIDPILGELILVSLLENVARHAAGPADVLARRDGRATIIDIADRGPGLPNGAARALREPMQPGERRGLGFAVCRTIAVRYGGSVDAAARAGGGTTLTITIPDGAPLPKLEREVAP